MKQQLSILALLGLLSTLQLSCDIMDDFLTIHANRPITGVYVNNQTDKDFDLSFPRADLPSPDYWAKRPDFSVIPRDGWTLNLMHMLGRDGPRITPGSQYFFQARISPHDATAKEKAANYIGFNQKLVGNPGGGSTLYNSLGGTNLSQALPDDTTLGTQRSTTWTIPDPKDPSKKANIRVSVIFRDDNTLEYTLSPAA